MRVAVVGHVEWVEFLRVRDVPKAGEIDHVLEAWAEPAGGGAVAAVQLCKLAGGADFFTALGDDEVGLRAERELSKLCLRLHVAWRDGPQRRAVTFIDGRGSGRSSSSATASCPSAPTRCRGPIWPRWMASTSPAATSMHYELHERRAF